MSGLIVIYILKNFIKVIISKTGLIPEREKDKLIKPTPLLIISAELPVSSHAT